MKIGIMGGTFDPIHNGHLLAAELARESAGLDEVWFMPSFVPPHKERGPVAPPSERLLMAQTAVEGHPHFRVTDIEIVKGGTSYTFETMELLHGQHPDVNFSYIIGADMVMYLPKWHRIEELTRRIGFIGLERPGYPLDLAMLPEGIRSSVTLVPTVQFDVSSTDIRKRLREGLSVRYLLPEPVRQYLEVKRIYVL